MSRVTASTRPGIEAPSNNPLSDSPEKTDSSTRAYGKSVGLLTVGVGLTGIFTYAYFLIASHDLSKDAYGEITVLWSAVFITVSTLYRPVDQLLSRSISEHIEKGDTDVGPVRVAAKILSCLALGFAVIALIIKGPLEKGLLAGNEVL